VVSGCINVERQMDKMNLFDTLLLFVTLFEMR
jgi:hypothetical protein